MKKMTRNTAIGMFERLGTIALGKLDDALLIATMNNIHALRKVADDFDALKRELFKRLYGDTEKMDETERKTLQEFFDMLQKIGHAKGEDVKTMEAACKAAFPKYYDVRVKELSVLVSLLNKEIEVDIEEVDERAFVKGIIAGNDAIKVHEVHAVFAPLFKTEEKKDADLSELDELLKKEKVFPKISNRTIKEVARHRRLAEEDYERKKVTEQID